MPALTWDDPEGIALALIEKFPGLDPLVECGASSLARNAGSHAGGFCRRIAAIRENSGAEQEGTHAAIDLG
jgi:hypothetical protein